MAAVCSATCRATAANLFCTIVANLGILDLRQASKVFTLLHMAAASKAQTPNITIPNDLGACQALIVELARIVEEQKDQLVEKGKRTPATWYLRLAGRGPGDRPAVRWEGMAVELHSGENARRCCQLESVLCSRRRSRRLLLASARSRRSSLR
jgi:hypothetical protein